MESDVKVNVLTTEQMPRLKDMIASNDIGDLTLFLEILSNSKYSHEIGQFLIKELGIKWIESSTDSEVSLLMFKCAGDLQRKTGITAMNVWMDIIKAK